MSNSPDPITYESAGKQREVPPGTSLPLVTNPFPSNGVAYALVGLAEGGHRGLASTAGAALLAGWATQITQDLSDAKAEIKLLNDKVGTAAAECGTERTKVAVLTEQLNSTQALQKRQAVCLLAGTTLLGVAIDLYRNSLWALCALITFLGVVLVGIGFFGGKGTK
jgi:hypothetical protein